MILNSTFTSIIFKKIFYFVAKKYNISYDAIIGRTRVLDVKLARHKACYIIKKIYPEIPYKKIGKFLDNRDHSTIVGSVKTVKGWVEVDKNIKYEMINLEIDIRNILTLNYEKV